MGFKVISGFGKSNYPHPHKNNFTSPETEDYVPDNYLRQVLIQPVFESLCKLTRVLINLKWIMSHLIIVISGILNRGICLKNRQGVRKVFSYSRKERGSPSCRRYFNKERIEEWCLLPGLTLCFWNFRKSRKRIIYRFYQNKVEIPSDQYLCTLPLPGLSNTFTNFGCPSCTVRCFKRAISWRFPGDQRRGMPAFYSGRRIYLVVWKI